MNNKKGFTLIELLAVIVILGLLMAIAIPSVTKYITESRKKTVVSTIGNYITAMVNEVNDLTYTFTGSNTIYAVPIECISLERGGTNPFGEWYQANDAYWAYVLVQYNDETSSYTYGYTFKDSAGYGLYPTSQAKINESGKQIQTGLNLKKPEPSSVTNITSIDNWNGFQVKSDTVLVVLEAGKEGEVGDGKETCTLQQKGNNYDAVIKDDGENAEEKLPDNALSVLIKKHNTLITATPTLTDSSNNTSDASGLYKSTATNTGDATYYFRGNVTNNYVSFAGLTWKIIRINEDGTVRMIFKDGIAADSAFDNANFSYYSNSDTAKPTVDSWYQTNISAKGYDSYVSTSTFCEQAKVKSWESSTNGNATMDYYEDYIPNFKCSTDGNGKGILNIKAGLLTYDEVIHAGGYYNKTNNNYYLKHVSNHYEMWTMSPDSTSTEFVWVFSDSLSCGGAADSMAYDIRPVINLNSNVLASGTGTSSDPYVIQTN